MVTEPSILQDRPNQSIITPETDKQYAIEFENVSRHYRLHHEPKLTLQDRAINLFKRNSSYEDFWALKNISFKVEKGKTLGVIGQNGAGKSTLLKLATRIMEPTSGTIRVNGRISAMLELGTGFHPDLSARDNIYLNGAFYGFNTKDMDERYERIVEFSELGKFIDTPVKHYSSGMYMRLGFAVAITVSPDILIIDEVLAVGDAAFGRKCHRAIEDLKRQSKAMMFVSHSAGEVSRFCDEVIYLSKGEIVARGKPGEVLDEYMTSSMGPSYFTSKPISSESKKPAVDSTPAPVQKANTPAKPNKTKTPAPVTAVMPAPLLPAIDTILPQMPRSLKTAVPLTDELRQYLQVSKGIGQRETHHVWQFVLPVKESNNLGKANVAPEYYLAILNFQAEPTTVELSGYKESGSVLDQSAGVLREVRMGKFEIEAEKLLIIRLEQGAVLNTSMLRVLATGVIAVELVEYKPLRQRELTPILAGGNSGSYNRFFPFCDIRADNICQFKLFNPQDKPVTVSLTLYRDWSHSVPDIKTFVCSPNSYLLIDLNEELAGGEGEREHGEGFYGGVMLKSEQPIIAERYSLQLTSPR